MISTGSPETPPPSPDATPSPAASPRGLKRFGRPLIALGILIALAVLANVTGLNELVTVESIRTLTWRVGILGPVVFVLLALAGVTVGVPGALFVPVGVIAYGAPVGGVLAWLGVSLGCGASVWWLSRLGGTPFQNVENRWVKKAMSLLEERPVAGVALIRVFLLATPPTNAALAFSGVPWRSHLVGTHLGLSVPVTLGVLATQAAIAF